jgi:hypothetical protein
MSYFKKVLITALILIGIVFVYDLFHGAQIQSKLYIFMRGITAEATLDKSYGLLSGSARSFMDYGNVGWFPKEGVKVVLFPGNSFPGVKQVQAKYNESMVPRVEFSLSQLPHEQIKSTNSLGYYSVELPEGMYHVCFIHPGVQGIGLASEYSLDSNECAQVDLKHDIPVKLNMEYGMPSFARCTAGECEVLK